MIMKAGDVRIGSPGTPAEGKAFFLIESTREGSLPVFQGFWKVRVQGVVEVFPGSWLNRWTRPLMEA
jgi:hypothetical protein